MSRMATSLVGRLRAVTLPQTAVLSTCFGLMTAGLLALRVGGVDYAVAPLLLLQALTIVVVLLAVRRISGRINYSTETVVQSNNVRVVERGKAGPKPSTSAASALGALRYYASTNRKRQADLVRQLVLDRSLDGRDILAYETSRGALDFRGVCVFLEAYRSPAKQANARRAAARFDREALLSLARVLYRQDALPEDLLNAATLYELACTAFKRRSLPIADAEQMIHALLQERRADEAMQWLEVFELSPQQSANYALIRANSSNPYAQPSASDEQAWLRWLNADFLRAGLEPVVLTTGEAPPSARLSAEARDYVEHGPLISVVMPLYRPGPLLQVAVRSVLAQSWRNLELIIVDDGSPAGSLQSLERWMNADSRIRLIRCANNRGTYTARNIGLDAAKGEFVTCHDADDWSHPRKIERQAKDLLANPDRIANVTTWLRVTEALEIHHRRPARSLAHTALVSLMFRREPVTARIGHWDAVRKMGDAEFLYRMEIAFGQKIEHVGDVPMSFALQDPNSLSGSDMYRGFMDPERQIYLTRYRGWHERIARGQASAYLATEPKARPFPAPASFLPSRGGREKFDVIFVSETGFKGGSGQSLLHEMSICAEAGLKVGLVRVKNLLFTDVAAKNPLPEITQLITEGTVTELAITTPADADLIIVRWPACFQFTSSLTPRIEAKRTVIVANHPPYERHQDRHSYEITTVTRNVRNAFGVEPQWVPQSATIRRMIAPQLAHGSLLQTDWVGVLAEERMRTDARRVPISNVAVIGRHSRDHHLKWPESRETLLKVYPPDGSVHVKVLGGVDQLLAKGVLAPADVANWEVHAFNALSPMEFLRSIDFFVYYHHKDWVESFGRVIMEAMFAGTVVILPPHFEAVFGDAAVYAEPDDVQMRIAAHYRDWPRFQAQSDRGLAYALRNCTPRAYRRRLADLGVDIEPGGARLEAAR